MIIRSKYLKELFIQCQLPFFPFPLLMMLCLVNFLFPQVEGIKWTCRGSCTKLIPKNVGMYLTDYKCDSVILIVILTENSFIFLCSFLLVSGFNEKHSLRFV